MKPRRAVDRAWESWGSQDPYFAVVTDPKFRLSLLTDEAKADFFETGELYLRGVLETLEKQFGPRLPLERALDFGCGVGRLVVPLSRVAATADGVDVAPSMLDEARKNCLERGVANVRFFPSDDELSQLQDRYDFIHSYIVFQHIPVARGEKLFMRLLDRLKPGGVCAVHFLYSKSYGEHPAKRAIRRLPLARPLIALFRAAAGKPPQMQMNVYDLNRLLAIVQASGARDCFVQFVDQAGDLGVVLYAQKPAP